MGASVLNVFFPSQNSAANFGEKEIMTKVSLGIFLINA